jgi:hypothetical protein
MSTPLDDDVTKSLDEFNREVNRLISKHFHGLVFSRRGMLSDQMTYLVYCHLRWNPPHPLLDPPRHDQSADVVSDHGQS